MKVLGWVLTLLASLGLFSPAQAQTLLYSDNTSSTQRSYNSVPIQLKASPVLTLSASTAGIRYTGSYTGGGSVGQIKQIRVELWRQVSPGNYQLYNYQNVNVAASPTVYTVNLPSGSAAAQSVYVKLLAVCSQPTGGTIDITASAFKVYNGNAP